MADELTEKLLASLSQSPRSSWGDIAARLGVSPSTVSRRVKKLVDDRVISFVGEVGWSFFSTTFPVHLWIRPKSGAIAPTIAKMVDLPQSQHVASTLGEYPIFATIHGADDGEIFSTINEIYSWESIETVAVSPVLRCATKASNWQHAYGAQILGCDEESPEPKFFRLDDLQQMSADDATELEVKAVAIIQRDCRTTATELAQRLSISKPAAHQVLEKILDRGWLRPRMEVSLSKLGFNTPYVLRIATKPSATEQVLRTLSEHPSCRFVTQVAGESDIFATGTARDRRDLANIVNHDFAQLPGVYSTKTDIIARDWKRYWGKRGDHGEILDFSPLPFT